MSIIHYIEYPTPGESLIRRNKPLSGWVSATKPVDRIEVSSGKQTDKNVRRTDRPDVAQHNRENFQHHTGFETSMTLGDFLGKNESAEITIRFFLGDHSCEEVVFGIGTRDLSEAKAKKLEKTARLLACPECHGTLDREKNNFYCKKCSNKYDHNGNSIDFLTKKFKKDFSIEPTENVSAWDYDLEIIKIIQAYPDRMFLDCGSGYRKTYYNNVINFEIVNYDSTDVLGVGEKLPFADNSLDGVFSVAVLEHVKDPFLCAREIERVIRPGGILFCAVAFLQPVHAYPHHYYNMTALGIRNLFQNMEIQREEVPLALHPAKSIAWMLRSYMNGLPEDIRGFFSSMTVKDLIEIDIPDNLHHHPVMTRLSQETRCEIAGGNAIIAKKKR